MGSDLWQCTLMATYSVASLGHQTDLLSHPVTLYWHWSNQSLMTYRNNAKWQARKQEVSICKSLVWFDQVSNTWAPELNPLSPVWWIGLHNTMRLLLVILPCYTVDGGLAYAQFVNSNWSDCFQTYALRRSVLSWGLNENKKSWIIANIF